MVMALSSCVKWPSRASNLIGFDTMSSLLLQQLRWVALLWPLPAPRTKFGVYFAQEWSYPVTLGIGK